MVGWKSLKRLIITIIEELIVCASTSSQKISECYGLQNVSEWGLNFMNIDQQPSDLADSFTLKDLPLGLHIWTSLKIATNGFKQQPIGVFMDPAWSKKKLA